MGSEGQAAPAAPARLDRTRGIRAPMSQNPHRIQSRKPPTRAAEITTATKFLHKFLSTYTPLWRGACPLPAPPIFAEDRPAPRRLTYKYAINRFAATTTAIAAPTMTMSLMTPFLKVTAMDHLSFASVVTPSQACTGRIFFQLFLSSSLSAVRRAGPFDHRDLNRNERIASIVGDKMVKHC